MTMIEHIDDELLLAYMEGDLSPEDKLKVEEHLKECRVCYENYIVYKDIMTSIVELPPLEAPARLDTLVNNVVERKSGGLIPILLSLLSSSFIVGAAYLLSLGIRFVWGRISIGKLMNPLIQALYLTFKAVYITRHLMEPMWVLAGMVVLSIPFLIILKRRLERYAGIID